MAREALAADGVPAGIGDQRETQTLTRDRIRRWAVVSAMPVRFSGVPSRLISSVDISELKATGDELRLAPPTDGLTDAYNGRYLLRKLGEEIERAKRYGNEVSVILPHTSIEPAIAIAERLRRAVKTLTWTQRGLRVTVSSDVCEYAGMDVDGLVEIADQRLYRAKEGGRDRVVGAS